MKVLWEWLDGNKTIIGTLLLAFVGTGIVAEHTFMYAFLQWLGGFMAAGGMVHKAIKGKANTGKQAY
jgi:hypothetical protein